MNNSVIKRNDNADMNNLLRHYLAPMYMGNSILRQLLEDTASASSLTRNEVERVVVNLIDTMDKYIKAGKNIEFDKGCPLYLSFTTEGSDKPEVVGLNKLRDIMFVLKLDERTMKQAEDTRFNLYK